MLQSSTFKCYIIQNWNIALVLAKITRILNSGSVQQTQNAIFKPIVEFEVWTKTSSLKFEFIARTNGK